MTSQKIGRTIRSAAATAAVIMTVGLVAAPAAAQPPPAPSTGSEALRQFKDLSAQVDKIHEDYLAAQTDLGNKQVELSQANSDFIAANQAEQQALAVQRQFRHQVDDLSSAAYQGARFSQLSALLSGNSPEDFLSRASALQVIATNNNQALDTLAAATRRAEDSKKKAADAQKRAQDATNAAHQLLSDIQQQKSVLEAQLARAKAALDRLSGQDRDLLRDIGDRGVFLAPAGAAGQAMTFALAQRGKPYVWGGAGPESYDCSGLTMAAYRSAGVALPHSSRAQSTMGVPVPRSQLRPGDLVVFGSPVHHVGIYVGAGKMVNAPDFGQVVKVEPLFNDYSGARRVAG